MKKELTMWCSMYISIFIIELNLIKRSSSYRKYASLNDFGNIGKILMKSNRICIKIRNTKKPWICRELMILKKLLSNTSQD